MHRRAVPVPNPSLPVTTRNYEGDYGLYVECPWRVRTDDAVLASWDDKEDDDGPMVAALERLVGTTVVSASVVAPARDLRLGFDNGLVLDVFASGSPRSDDDDYSIFTPLVIYAVGRGGRVETEERVSD